jgi:hypothetical protein
MVRGLLLFVLVSMFIIQKSVRIRYDDGMNTRRIKIFLLHHFDPLELQDMIL